MKDLRIWPFLVASTIGLGPVTEAFHRQVVLAGSQGSSVFPSMASPETLPKLETPLATACALMADNTGETLNPLYNAKLLGTEQLGIFIPFKPSGVTDSSQNPPFRAEPAGEDDWDKHATLPPVWAKNNAQPVILSASKKDSHKYRYMFGAAARAHPQNWATYYPSDMLASEAPLYNPAAVIKCWSEKACSIVYSTISKCYQSMVEVSGGMTNPNNQVQSRAFRDCLCSQVRAGQDGLMTMCTECLRKAGVPDLAVDVTDDKLNDFCSTADPNLLMWLSDFLNFTLSIAPHSTDDYSSSWTLPLQGALTQFTSQTTVGLTSDSLANKPGPTRIRSAVWLTLASTTLEISPKATITSPYTAATTDTTTLSPSNLIATYWTSVHPLTTSTMATRAGAAILLVSTQTDVLVGTWMTTTIGLVSPPSDTRVGTFTVSLAAAVAGRSSSAADSLSDLRHGGSHVILRRSSEYGKVMSMAAWLWTLTCFHLGVFLVLVGV